MPVLSGIGALQLIGDVQMLLDVGVLVFKYSTDSAAYVTAIPTFNKKTKKRNDQAFIYYKPKILKDKPLTAVEQMIKRIEEEDTDYSQLLIDDDLIPVYGYEE